MEAKKVIKFNFKVLVMRKEFKVLDLVYKLAHRRVIDENCGNVEGIIVEQEPSDSEVAIYLEGTEILYTKAGETQFKYWCDVYLDILLRQ